MLIDNEKRLREVATDHFTWSCRKPSPFLSVFAQKKHALNWAKKLRDHRSDDGSGDDSDIYITPVITALLPPNIYYFKASTLCSKLSIEHGYNSADDEFVVRYHIPWQALGQMRDLDAFDRELEGELKDNDTHSMIKLSPRIERIAKANDTCAEHIAIAQDRDLTAYQESNPSVADVFRNLIRDINEHHQALVWAMAEMIVLDAEKGKEPNNKASSSIRNPFPKVCGLLHPPLKYPLGEPINNPTPPEVVPVELLPNPSPEEVALDEITGTPGSLHASHLEGIGKRTAAVSSTTPRLRLRGLTFQMLVDLFEGSEVEAVEALIKELAAFRDSLIVKVAAYKAQLSDRGTIEAGKASESESRSACQKTEESVGSSSRMSVAADARQVHVGSVDEDVMSGFATTADSALGTPETGGTGSGELQSQPKKKRVVIRRRVRRSEANREETSV
jgi:hypothetical protein